MSTCQVQEALNSGSLPGSKVGASPVRLVYCSPSRFDDSIHRVFSPQTRATRFAALLFGNWLPTARSAGLQDR